MKKWPKKYIGILFVLVIALIYVFTLSNSYLQTYKFGVTRAEYPEFFNSKYSDKELNQEYLYFYKEANENSSLTDIILSDGTNKNIIQLEHLVKIEDIDTQIIKDLNGTNYLFSAVMIPFNNVSRIEMKHYYNGKDLEEFGTYIYRFDNDESIKEVKNIKDISDLSLEKNYALVKIYKLPELQRNKAFQTLIPKKYWFNNDVKQEIEIEYLLNGDIKKANYTFKLNWFIYESIWSKLLTIT